MVILDTSVIVDFLLGKHKIVEAVNRYQSFELATTFVNIYELLKYKGRTYLEKPIENLLVYHSSGLSIRESSSAYKMTKVRGKLISDSDLLIFGVAIANGETILTQDKDFKNLGSERVVLIE
jgi:predicted nucleic acid-binding protein